MVGLLLGFLGSTEQSMGSWPASQVGKTDISSFGSENLFQRWNLTSGKPLVWPWACKNICTQWCWIYLKKFGKADTSRKGATQNGIKTIVLIKNMITKIPHPTEFNNRTIADTTVMINVFHNYFTSIAEKTQSNIKFLSEHYTDYVSTTNTKTFFLTPTDKNEISFISSHKSSGSNSIPVKILKFLKNDISQQLIDIFHMSFSTE